MDAQKALQLSALLSQLSTQYTAGNPGQNQFAEHLLSSAQAGIQAEALKKEKKKQEKQEKGAMGGAAGAVLGSAAGIALAPVTGGASLALAGAAGGALGSTAGTLLAGGSPTAGDALGYAVEGGLGGHDSFKQRQKQGAYKQGRLAQTVMGGAESTAVAPAAPPHAENLMRDQRSAITAAAPSAAPASSFKLTDSLVGFTPPTREKKPKFGERFGDALTTVMDQRAKNYRIRRQPTGTPDIYMGDY